MDSDWAAGKIRWRLVTGFFFKLAGGVISWRSHTQKTVALSSMEAEYMAISDCSKQAICKGTYLMSEPTWNLVRAWLYSILFS